MDPGKAFKTTLYYSSLSARFAKIQLKFVYVVYTRKMRTLYNKSRGSAGPGKLAMICLENTRP
jgi:hypothetical protein